MCTLLGVVERAFVTVAPERLPWIPARTADRVFLLPVGSNVLPGNPMAGDRDGFDSFTVAVFGVTGQHACEEVRVIAETLATVSRSVGKTRLLAVGRGTGEAAPLFERFLRGSGVKVVVRGLAPAPEVSEALSSAHALLFVRGSVSSRRGTVVAAIAHGLPIVGYDGSEAAWPITEAGVVLCAPGDTDALATSLVRLALDTRWAEELRYRSRSAYERYFSWARIAERFEEGLACAG
jgi:glycosyltransferase involved in cell wall biosynthesis